MPPGPRRRALRLPLNSQSMAKRQMHPKTDCSLRNRLTDKCIETQAGLSKVLKSLNQSVQSDRSTAVVKARLDAENAHTLLELHRAEHDC